MTKKFDFTREEFFKVICENEDITEIVAEALMGEDGDVAQITNFCKNEIEKLHKPRNLNPAKLAQRNADKDSILDSIPFDEPITLAAISANLEMSTQKIVALIKILNADGANIEKVLIDKKVGYQRKK